MSSLRLPQNSKSQVSYFPREIVRRIHSLSDVSKLFTHWSLESWDSDTRSGSNFHNSWFQPAHLAFGQPTIWLSVCPLCSEQGPEWASVVLEPCQSQPFSFSSEKKPFLALADSDDSWSQSGESYSCFRANQGIPSKKKEFPQDRELLAASVGNVEWLHQCMKYQQDIRSDRRGFTALHLAAERGNLDCIIALVDQYKFPVEQTTTKGWAALHLAINKDNPVVSLKCIEYLIKKGAPVNVRNRNGTTPLHLASEDGLLECIKVLVEAGADVHALDNQNRKGIDLCKAWNHRDCARYLKDAMWKQDKKELAEEMGQLKLLKKQLLVMQNKYLLKKKKEKDVQNQVAFSKWLQTKPLSKLPKVKGLVPALVTKQSAPVIKKSDPVTKKSASVTKKSSPVTKERPRVKKEPPRVTKEAPHVKKKSPQPKKPQPPTRPQPPSKRRPALTPPSCPRLRALKRTKPSNPRAPWVNILPSLSPLIPSHHSPGSPQSKCSPGSPLSSSHLPCSASPPSTVHSGAFTLLKSEGSASSSSRPATTLYLSHGFSPSPRHSRFGLRQTYPLLHPPSEPTHSELKRQDGQKLGSSTSPVPPEQPLSLLDTYLAKVSLSPPPARPSSPFRWTAKWNLSTKPEAEPATQIAFPQGVRLGVNPDPVPEPDFCDYLKFSPDGEGGVHIQTADGQWIFPVPRLPFKVLLRELCPSRQHQRLKVPDGLRRLAVQDLPRRRYAGDQSFWTDSMAMSLRETFDPAFISLVRKHQGLPPVSPSSPSSSSSSSATSPIALRKCWSFLFCFP